MKTAAEVLGVFACLFGFVLVVGWLFSPLYRTEYECRPCERVFGTRRELNEHIARHPN